MHSNPKHPTFTRFCTDAAIFCMIWGAEEGDECSLKGFSPII